MFTGSSRRVLALLVSAIAFGVVTACTPPQPACPGSTTAAGWHKEILDGDALCGGLGRQPGFVTGNTPNNVSLAIDGQPHVFYVANPTGSTSGDVRHAWYTGTAWRYETVDGDGADSGTATTRTNFNVGEGLSVVLWDGRPAVFYYSSNNGVLRLARWTGTAWTYQNLTAGGASSRDLIAVMYGGVPHIFHNDGSGGADLHHRWWTGAGWSEEDLDGHADSPNGARTRSAAVGVGIRALVMGTQIQLFYNDDFAATQDVRHAWYSPGPGAGWRVETLDGDGIGAHTAHGLFTGAAVMYGGAPHLFYSDADSGALDLRHAWWTGTAWSYEVLDGDAAGARGRVDGRLGGAFAVATFGTQLDVFYVQSDGLTNAIDYWVRHAWYSPTLGWSREILDDPAAPRFVTNPVPPNPPPTPQTTGGTRGPGSALVWNGQLHLFVTRVYGTYTGDIVAPGNGAVNEADLRHVWYG